MCRTPESDSAKTVTQNPLGSFRPALSASHFAPPAPCAAVHAGIERAARNKKAKSRRMSSIPFVKDVEESHQQHHITRSSRDWLFDIGKPVGEHRHRRDALIEIVSIDHRHGFNRPVRSKLLKDFVDIFS